MSMMILNRPLEGEPLCPPTTHRTRSRLASLIRASGLAGEDFSGFDARISGGHFADPRSGIALLATSCNRPLFYPEGEAFAQITQMDLVVFKPIFTRDARRCHQLFFYQGNVETAVCRVHHLASLPGQRAPPDAQ